MLKKNKSLIFFCFLSILETWLSWNGKRVRFENVKPWKEREQEVQEQRKRGRAGASTARSSIARQTHAFVTTSWQDLDIAPGHSHARYARALGRLELGVSSKVFKTFQRLPMPSKALPRASKKLPRASEASKSEQKPPTYLWQNVYNT